MYNYIASFFSPPPSPIDRALLSSLLTLDEKQRKNSDLELLTEQDLEQLFYIFSSTVPVSPNLFSIPRHSVDKSIFSSLQQPTAKKVLARLGEAFPHTQTLLNFAPDNLLVAGGSVVQAVIEPTVARPWGDIDIFFYNLTPDQATIILKQQIDYLFQKHPLATVVRNQHTLTVGATFRTFGQLLPVSYQFVLRIFKSPAQILNSFDLPLCSIGYGLQIGLIATPLGGFCLATKTLLVDTTRMNATSSQTRIVKYHQRGFQIIIPSFKPPEKAWEPLTLGKLTFHIALPAGTYQNVYVSSERPKYDISEYGQPSFDPHLLAVYNWRRIRAGAREWSDLNFTANSFDEAIQRPEAPGIGIGQIDEWFEDSNLSVNMVDYTDLNWYTEWDIDERMDTSHRQELLKAWEAKDPGSIVACINDMKATYVRTLQNALNTIPATLQWELTGPGWPTPRSGVLKENEFYPEGTWRPSLLGLRPEVAFCFHLIRKQNPHWASLPQEVYQLVVEHLTLVDAQNTVDEFYTQIATRQQMTWTPK